MGGIYIKLISKKAVISGNVIEFYEYQKPVFKDYQIKSSGTGQDENEQAVKIVSDDEKLKNRAEVQYRAKKMLRRLINANTGQYKDVDGNIITTKFLTLTFAENQQNLSLANKQFKTFIQRLNYKIYGRITKLKYVVAIEFQLRGAIHYHLVLFNMPVIKQSEIGTMWGNGFIKINKITEVDNIGSYVTKYMGKDLDDDKLQGKKCYMTSQGLFKPIEIEDKEKVELLQTTLQDKDLVYSNTYKNEYTGNTIYAQYNMGKKNNKLRQENYVFDHTTGTVIEI